MRPAAREPRSHLTSLLIVHGCVGGVDSSFAFTLLYFLPRMAYGFLVLRNEIDIITRVRVAVGGVPVTGLQ